MKRSSHSAFQSPGSDAVDRSERRRRLAFAVIAAVATAVVTAIVIKVLLSPLNPPSGSAEGEIVEPRGLPARTSVWSDRPSVNAHLEDGADAVESFADRRTTSFRPGEESPATPAARMIQGLIQEHLDQRPLRGRAAEGLNRRFKEIAAQGDAAIPAIREFLGRHVDLTFTSPKWAPALEQESLRLGLINALHEIGSPQAIELLREALATTALPGEIARLARHLDALEPGVHSHAILAATRETLALASRGGAPGQDTGPLFEMLQDLKGALAVPVLEEMAPDFRYYSSLALARLTEGQGVPALAQLAAGGGESRSRLNDFALLMLGQVSSKHSEARAALLDATRRKDISEPVWRLLGQALAGEEMRIGPPSAEGLLGGSLHGAITYRHPTHNQIFHSIPVSRSWTREQIDDRVSLIDEVLANTSSPRARPHLESARSALLAAKSPPSESAPR